ncbi:hypothetical protein HPS57_02520 [Prevotella sp. PINT]|jgi:hypothetical protein|uniref:BT0820 family HAD-type phosphatase n=1 Tax=Palleniella intestinalis TaxID=2736291 RepID=UPI001553EA4C|nr:hypothetical protein [Palleniella intestinalis]NPD80852.1 hypothetical protein [Palleniella intestinalis]
MTIAIDFDGTIVTHEYPNIGEEQPFAIETLKMLIADKHRLILWTVREGELLDEAIQWCRERGVEFWAVNRDYPEEEREKNDIYSRKLKVDMFIDDRNVGGLPDWGTIYQMIKENKTYNDIMFETTQNDPYQQNPNDKPKKKWWQF